MFIDTNVLVYTRFPTAPQHVAASEVLSRIGASGEPMRISRQIMREYLAAVTRPQAWADAVLIDDALDDVRDMIASYEVLEDGPRVTRSLLSLCGEVPVGGRQIHDANIVATMLVHEERRLLTFNVADFRRYGHLIELVDTSL